MPTRKQRRRREKNFRHEYETVLLDPDGTEHAVDPEELRTEREAKAHARADARPKQARAGGRPAARSRALREVAPPSWHRAFRRGGLMGGAMLVAFLFLFKSASIEVRVAWGLFYALAFVPLTYWIDRTAYRSYERRLAKRSAKKWRSLPAAVVPGAGPRREHDQDTRAVGARQRVPFVGLEARERPRAGLERRPVTGRDLHRSLDDDDPGVLLHLVIAERLPRLQA